MLVVIDDAHQADTSSLRLLAELAPALRTMPAAVLVTARDGDRDWRGRLDMRTTLLRSGLVISLQPLAASDTRRRGGRRDRRAGRAGPGPRHRRTQRMSKADAPVSLDEPEIEGRYVDLDGYTVGIRDLQGRRGPGRASSAGCRTTVASVRTGVWF